MIRDCTETDFDAILSIINDGADAYRGIIPADRWKEPYMPADELRAEIGHGVAFSGFEAAGGLVGVMGAQNVADVALIRHAYVRGVRQGRGIGGSLLRHLLERTDRPLLIGTWAAARWAAARVSSPRWIFASAHQTASSSTPRSISVSTSCGRACP